MHSLDMRYQCTVPNASLQYEVVIPAKAGIQFLDFLDSVPRLDRGIEPGE